MNNDSHGNRGKKTGKAAPGRQQPLSLSHRARAAGALAVATAATATGIAGCGPARSANPVDNVVADCNELGFNLRLTADLLVRTSGVGASVVVPRISAVVEGGDARLAERKAYADALKGSNSCNEMSKELRKERPDLATAGKEAAEAMAATDAAISQVSALVYSPGAFRGLSGNDSNILAEAHAGPLNTAAIDALNLQRDLTNGASDGSKRSAKQGQGPLPVGSLITSITPGNAATGTTRSVRLV